MNNRNDTAILILSCDKYADIWGTFFAFFHKFWPECPYRIYLGTNESELNDPKVTTIKSGPAKSWTEDTRAILEQISEKYVIVLLEDYFVYQKVDQVTLDNSIALMEKEKAVFMRIGCFPADHFLDYAYDKILESPWCGRTRTNAVYGINLQAGIWNREEFLGLLHEKENPWQFEIQASKRWAESGKVALGIVEDPKLDYVHGPITYLCTALSKGVWMRDAFTLAQKEHIPLDTGNRPIETKGQYRRRRIYHSLPFWSRKYIDFVVSKFKRK